MLHMMHHRLERGPRCSTSLSVSLSFLCCLLLCCGWQGAHPWSLEGLPVLKVTTGGAGSVLTAAILQWAMASAAHTGPAIAPQLPEQDAARVSATVQHMTCLGGQHPSECLHGLPSLPPSKAGPTPNTLQRLSWGGSCPHQLNTCCLCTSRLPPNAAGQWAAGAHGACLLLSGAPYTMPCAPL